MRDHDISQRRACRIVGVDPKTVRRDRPPDNADVREAMKEIAGKRRRFGYRRIGVLLEIVNPILQSHATHVKGDRISSVNYLIFLV